MALPFKNNLVSPYTIVPKLKFLNGWRPLKGEVHSPTLVSLGLEQKALSVGSPSHLHCLSASTSH